MNRLLLLASVLLLATALSCTDESDDDPTSSPDANLTGLWTLVADGFSPPTTFACNGEHSGMASTPLCGFLDLDLEPDGGAYTGTSTQKYCGADFTAFVGVNGENISGQIVADEGTEVWRFSFTGTAIGTIAVIEPGTFSVDGLSGNCTTAGFYNGAL